MARRLVARIENAGALHRNVDVKRLVGQIAWIANGRNSDALARNYHVVAVDADLSREAAMNRIKTQQMRIGLDRTKIVDADDLDILSLGLHYRTQDVASDATEAVDEGAYGH